MPKNFRKPPTSSDFDSLAVELSQLDGRNYIQRTCDEVEALILASDLSDAHKSFVEIGRAQKKNFAQRLSASLAQKFADALRSKLRTVVPDEQGLKHESRIAGAGGKKKLDVIYMTPEAGVQLAISIKTVNFRDPGSKRYTKNIKRVDGELRAEAEDVHQRQPWAVLAATVFLPRDAASDGVAGPSSLYHAWDVFRRRSGRDSTNAEHSKFEVIYLCVYDSEGPANGLCECFSVAQQMPERGTPNTSFTLTQVLSDIDRAFQQRNRP